jgi:hypothetical protein
MNIKRFYTQAVLKFLKLDTQAQQREAIVHGRSLPPILVSVWKSLEIDLEWFLLNWYYPQHGRMGFALERQLHVVAFPCSVSKILK